VQLREKAQKVKKVTNKILGISKDVVKLYSESMVVWIHIRYHGNHSLNSFFSLQTEAEYNLRDIHRWASTENIFTMDVGDLADGFIILLTNEGEEMANLITGYLKRRTGMRNYFDEISLNFL
jgi:hypothetical protein